MKRVWWLIVPSLVGLSSLMAGKAAGRCDNPYFPIRDGASWTYRSQVQGAKPRQYTQVIEQVGNDTFVMRQSFGEVTNTFRWKCGAQGLASPEFAAVGGDSRAQMEVTSFSGVIFPPARKWVVGTSWEYSYKVRGKVGRAAQGEMTGDVKTTSKIIGEESVKVAAGSFRALKVVMSMKMNLTMKMGGRSTPINNTLESTSWFVRGVGLVKSSFEGGSSELLGYKL